MRTPVPVGLLLLLLAGPVAGEDGAELSFQGDPAQPAYGGLSVELPAQVARALADAELDRETASEILALFVAAEDADLPPIYGDHLVEGSTFAFTPRFPLRTGLEVRGRFDAAALARLVPSVAAVASELGTVETTFTTRDAEAAPSTRVLRVEPAGDVVPANLLRVYLHFSAPMRDHEITRHVRVVDDAGAEVPLPFVEIRDGLWDPDRRRLTLIFHPGRLKRGVAPHDELGPPLEEGRRYALVVDGDLRDADGLPLAEPFRHDFRVGPTDRTSPDPAAWAITSPPAGSREPLVVDLVEPADPALLRRMIHLETATGELVAGTVDVGNSGAEWRLTPAAPWTAGPYRLVVDPALEDLAGNRVDRRFEEATAGSSAESESRVREVTILDYP